MANALYRYGGKQFLTKQWNWSSDAFSVVLVSNGYTFDATHQFLSSILASNRLATAALAGKTVLDDAAIDANDVTFSNVVGSQAKALVIYRATGSDGTAGLLCYLDTGAGLPFTPNGGNVTVSWDDGTPRILRL